MPRDRRIDGHREWYPNLSMQTVFNQRDIYGNIRVLSEKPKKPIFAVRDKEGNFITDQGKKNEIFFHFIKLFTITQIQIKY